MSVAMRTLCSLCGKRPRDPQCPVRIIDDSDRVETVCKQCYEDIGKDRKRRGNSK